MTDRLIASTDITYALGYTPYDASNPAGYLTAATIGPVNVGVATFNGRTGAVALASGDVTTALTFTPYDAANPSGYLTTATAQIVYQPALGYVPYSTSNPAGYQAASDVANSLLPYAFILSPALTGTPLAPTAATGTNTTQIATTAFVAASVVASTTGVSAFNGRTGNIIMSSSDVTTALSYTPYAATNPAGYLIAADAAATYQLVIGYTPYNSTNPVGYQTAANVAAALAVYAPLASPSLSGVPVAPTPLLGDSSTQVATTAFVARAVVASTSGVASFNARTGAVSLSSNDVNVALTYTAYNAANPSGYQTAPNVQASLGIYAPLLSPALVGTPLAPTPAVGTSTTQIATTAFVAASVAASTTGVASVNTRTGAVVLNAADITAALTYTPYNSSNPTGYQTAPAVAATLLSYATLSSPALTGVPLAPTAQAGTSTTQLATTAFVAASVAASTTGVSSVNTRTGAVTLIAGDITNALTYVPYNSTNPAGHQTAANVATTLLAYAPLASPAMTGVPLAPTAVPGTSTTQLATTAFVANSVAASTTGVSAFNTRTGAITLLAADVSAALTFTPYSAANPAAYQSSTNVTATLLAYAPLSSPALTGVPTAPTAAANTSTGQVASTAFVAAAVLSSTAGVTQFNTRKGAITLSAADVSGALAYTPYDAANPTGYLTATTAAPLIAASKVTVASAFTIVPLTGFAPDNATVSFALTSLATGLPVVPLTAYELLVSVDGYVQRALIDYTVASSTITFLVPPAIGLPAFALWLTSAVAPPLPGDGIYDGGSF